MVMGGPKLKNIEPLSSEEFSTLGAACKEIVQQGPHATTLTTLHSVMENLGCVDYVVDGTTVKMPMQFDSVSICFSSDIFQMLLIKVIQIRQFSVSLSYVATAQILPVGLASLA